MDDRYSEENMRTQARMNRWTRDCARASKQHGRDRTETRDEELADRLAQDGLPDYIRNAAVSSYDPATGELRTERPFQRSEKMQALMDRAEREERGGPETPGEPEF